MRTTCRRHGRYVKGCADCADQSAEYRRTRLAEMRDGNWDHPLTGEQLQPVRRHVRKLLATAGVTPLLVGRACDVSRHTVSRIADGSTKRLGRQKAQALLAVTAQRCLGRVRIRKGYTSSVGVSRRLQALSADGWDSRSLSDLSGFSLSRLSHLRTGIGLVVLCTIHDRICELYDKIQSLADPSGPSKIAAIRARSYGYLLPERWADEDIDNPDAQPLPPSPETEDHVAITREIEDCLRDPQPSKAAGLPLPAKRELARHAHIRLGWSWERLAWLFGYKGASSAQYLVDGRPGRTPKTSIRRTRK